MRKWVALLLTVLAALNPAVAFAQQGLAAAADSGDTAWLMASAALVLVMTIPGLMLFYGGRLRATNILSVTLQCGAVAAMASLLWIVIGYTLAFGQVSTGAFGGWIGGGNAWMLINLSNVREGTNVPESAFALFHMSIAMFAPSLMAGAWVERARFGWVIGFCALWGLIVYAPVAHWIWGGGWLGGRVGTLDYGGGIAVHTTAGISALVVALMMGKRHGFLKVPMPSHSPVMSIAGAALLWLGWFGMSGGATLGANDDAASAIINTHVAASVAALVWLLIEKIKMGKSTAMGFAKGAVAGLVTVSPAAGFISPGAAILLGAIAAGVCYPAIQMVKQRLKIDDSLDVFAVHGVGGITGSLLLALFLTPALGGTGYAQGMFMAKQFGAQVIGVGVVAAWAAIASVILALGVSLFLPMRVSEEEEREGLDLSSHGERAWAVD